MQPQHKEENQIVRHDRDIGSNPILDAGGNPSARRKPARSEIDRNQTHYNKQSGSWDRTRGLQW